MRRVALFLLTLFIASCAAGPPPRPVTQALVIATIHGAHRGHAGYSYARLYETVAAFAPDVVAVEVRPEDMGADPAYLARNYPREMLELAARYAPGSVGIDWLGDDLAGRAIPDDWWTAKSWVKALERRQARDAGFSVPALDALRDRQNALIASATPAALNDGRYDALTRAYYAGFDNAVAGGPYQRLAHFYRARDARIAANAVRLVARNPGARIAIVVGADHRAAVIDTLRRRFGRRLALAAIPPPQD